MMRRACKRLHDAPRTLLGALVAATFAVAGEGALLLRRDSAWHGVDALALLLTLGGLALVLSELRQKEQPGDRECGDARNRG